MSLPPVTHLQFLILELLRTGEQPGRQIRQMLERHDVRRSLPAFYQLMTRLEDAGMVAGRYARKLVGGQSVKERRYKLTVAGGHALEETRDFYRRGFANAARTAEGV